jgi:hypothetical protein
MGRITVHSSGIKSQSSQGERFFMQLLLHFGPEIMSTIIDSINQN